MSVYTTLEAADIQPLLDDYQQGTLLEYEGIAAGIENTNYFVVAQQTGESPRQFVLTLFETTSSDNLAGYFDLMAKLATLNLPVANPYKNRRGTYTCEVKNKPCALIERLPGESSANVTPQQCEAAGEFLANMHAIANLPARTLRNTRGGPWRDQVMTKLANAGINYNEPLIKNCHETGLSFEQAELPRGIVHGDLFHDNALFIGNKLTGVIDFYYAHPAPYIYDLAVCIADWCFVLNNGNLNQENASTLMRAYQRKRAINSAEAAAWVGALELAGLRFYLSRLHDKHFPRPGTITQEKDPSVFLNLIKLCRDKPEQLNAIIVP